MATAAGHRIPECELLSFCYDDKGTSELTVLANSVRFHITANGKAWKKASGKAAKLAEEYGQLLSAVKHEDDLKYTKPCSKENLRGGSQDSAHGSSPQRDSESSSDADSAVDVKGHSAGKAALVKESDNDPDLALRKWMLKPFGPIFDKEAPASDKQNGLSVEKWYSRPTLFYSLEIEDGQLSAQEEHVTEELEKKMSDIIPRLYAPKWMRDMNIPWYAADELIVEHESNEPEPYHPIVVKHESDQFFLKMVDPSQSSPTKREVKLLKEIEKKGLHKKFNVPLLKGLVGFENSKTEMMGFLLTMIDEPKPLTKYLDGDVPQEKRDNFASEVSRIVELLHANDIIFGDCKSDNFLVDKHEELWIIDFGGSYTDGWVDQELMETEEGDDMAVERIVNGLHDPEANTWDPEQDKTLPFASESQKGINSKKRKADESDVNDTKEEEEEERGSPARNRASPRQKRIKRGPNGEKVTKETQPEVEEGDSNETSGEAPDEETASTAEEEDDDADSSMCYCGKASSGDMVGCDNEDCKREWFHFECVGLKSAPKSDKWYCPDCKT